MRKLYFILSLLIPAGFTTAQDLHLSQYDAAALNFNPAMTGLFKGNIRVHGHYRTQWSSIATRPYQTGIIAVDGPWKKLAVGLQLANYIAGVGNYNVATAHVSLAYDIKLSSNNAHHLSIGAQGGAFQKSINYDKLTWGNQYTPFNGGYFDQSATSGETFASYSTIKGDANAGLIYYYAKETALINPFIGGSVFHINQPTESFFNANNKLPLRWIGHGGFKLNFSERIQLTLKAFYMGEKNARELTYAADLHVYLKDSDSYLIFGPTYRNEDAAVVCGGLKMGKFIYRVSYDINTSTLKPTTNGRGGLEVSITFINYKVNPNPVKTCPRI